MINKVIDPIIAYAHIIYIYIHIYVFLGLQWVKHSIGGALRIMRDYVLSATYLVVYFLTKLGKGSINHDVLVNCT